MEATPAAMIERVAKPEPPPRASAPSTPPPVQPRLAGLDPADRITPRKSEEDMLDIPAFLRRQAN
jgi:cell division protein FtsZ